MQWFPTLPVRCLGLIETSIYRGERFAGSFHDQRFHYILLPFLLAKHSLHLTFPPPPPLPSSPQELKADTGIDLENIVYYKDDTHYFVMTAKKYSLLKKGVLVAVSHVIHTHWSGDLPS